MNTIIIFSILFLYSCSHRPQIDRSIGVSQWDAASEESLIRHDTQRLSGLKGTKGLCYKGNIKEGLQTLKSSFYEKRSNPHYWIEIGNCYYLNGEDAKAEFFYLLSLNETKSSKIKAIAFNNLAILELRNKNFSIAQDLFNKSIASDNNLKLPRYNLALLLLDFKLVDQADRLVSSFSQSHDIDFISINAHIALMKNDIKRAGDLFSRLPQFSLNRSDISVLYASYLTKTNKMEKAGELLQNRRPSNVDEIEDLVTTLKDQISNQVKGK